MFSLASKNKILLIVIINWYFLGRNTKPFLGLDNGAIVNVLASNLNFKNPFVLMKTYWN